MQGGIVAGAGSQVVQKEEGGTPMQACGEEKKKGGGVLPGYDFSLQMGKWGGVSYPLKKSRAPLSNGYEEIVKKTEGPHCSIAVRIVLEPGGLIHVIVHG